MEYSAAPTQKETARKPTGVSQRIYAFAAFAWQVGKQFFPFLHNHSFRIGTIAARIFPPVDNAVTAKLPWSDDPIEIPPGSPSSRIYLCQRYELEAVDKILKLDLEGTTTIDVGAHAGYYSRLFAHKVGPAGEVISFEPNPTSFSYLKRNSLGYPILSMPWAVGAEVGEGYLTDPELIEHGKLVDQGKLKVSVVTLDYIMAHRTKKLGAIKIDTEGGEVAVLRGARKLLEEHPETSLFIEHQCLPENDAWEELSKLLSDYGFYCYEVLERGTQWTLGFPFPYPQERIVYNLYFPPRK